MVKKEYEKNLKSKQKWKIVRILTFLKG